MSNIQTYLDEIREALYGEEVRSSIINAINQCYQDAADGIRPEFEFSAVQNGTRVTIKVGDESSSFNVVNGARTQLVTRTYSSASTSCGANTSGTVNIPVAFPEDVDFVGVINTWSSGDIAECYCNTSAIADGGNATVKWINTTNTIKTETFTINVLFIVHIEEASGDEVIRNTMYPVGSVYISTNSANPNLLFGGTWRAIGQGRCLVGVGSVEANTSTSHGSVTAGSFSPAVNERGGTYSHSHNAGNLAAAIGNTDSNINSLGYNSVAARPTDKSGTRVGPSTTNRYAFAVDCRPYDNGETYSFNQYTSVHGHVENSDQYMPYLAVYIWERTA